MVKKHNATTPIACAGVLNQNEKVHTKFVYDELANGNNLNFEVSILF